MSHAMPQAHDHRRLSRVSTVRVLPSPACPPGVAPVERNVENLVDRPPSRRCQGHLVFAADAYSSALFITFRRRESHGGAVDACPCHRNN